MSAPTTVDARPLRPLERVVISLFPQNVVGDEYYSAIVTRSERERIKAGGAGIEVVPAWRFLLDIDPVGG